jgi:ABC-type sugar transport system substrate-binding protein
MKKLLALSAIVAALALIATACGSSGSDTGTSTAEGSSTSTEEQASGGSSLVEEAEANLAKLTQDPPKITVPPVKKPIPTGETLTFGTCPLPVCVAVEEGAEEAAKVLGWSFKPVNQGLTPATVTSAWNGIAQNPGSAVAADAVLPNSALTKQLEAVAAKEVPYVGVAQNDPPGELMVAATAAPNQMYGDGQALANWVIVNAEGEPSNSLFVYDPALVDLAHAQVGYHDTMEEMCPECTVSDLKVAAADSGTKIPEEVANQLRTNPDIEYVVFGLGDYATGVPQALKRANLPSSPILTTRAASTTNMEDIKNGEMASGLTSETVESGWRTVDLLVRVLAGEELYSDTPVGGRTVLTAENLPEDVSVPFKVPGFEKVFEEAWGK